MSRYMTGARSTPAPAIVPAVFTLFVLATSTLSAQQLPTLEPEDYGRWEYLLGPEVAPFADWVA